MGEDVYIVPTILTNNPQVFATELQDYLQFAKRIQIDLMDGTFTADKSLPESAIAGLPQGIDFDLHLMSARPSDHLAHLLRLKPSLCILHAEASEDLSPFFAELKKAGIKTGLALLPGTYPGQVKSYIEAVDHILVFAGALGKQGGQADLLQMEKIKLIREINPTVEIGWDGGANLTNVRALAHADLNVINVGSAISKTQDPKAAYHQLIEESKKRGII